LNSERLAQEVSYLRERERSRYGDLIGDSPAMLAVFETLRRLEGVDAPTVLITGESGTGKELVAQAIHQRGPRREAPFVAIDCASLPETLIESELFGHERGAFTDARLQKRGLFEVARGGTVFLDEIGEMPVGTQSKLLRALENRRIKRVGGVSEIQFDAGIVAATNRDLAKEVQAGRFRSDLYYRLAVILIDLPPLRQRAGDVAKLVGHFLEQLTKRIPGLLDGVSAPALEAMNRYSWPGNVREVKNVMERIATLYREDTQIELAHLPPEIKFAAPTQVVTTSGSSRFVLPPEGVDLDAVERDFVIQALERTESNQTAAAKLLGISRYALRNRMEKYGLK
jgi:transcriptional regulator with PAS, ATPase and Fis domain